MHHQKFRHPNGEEGLDAEATEATEHIVNSHEPSPKKAKVETELRNEKQENKNSEAKEILVAETVEASEETREVEETVEPIPKFKDWPSDPVQSVEQKYLVKMPEDFMALWDFCKGMNRENPRLALQKSCELVLVGPYDIVAGDEFKSTNLNDFLCHRRYA